MSLTNIQFSCVAADAAIIVLQEYFVDNRI